MKKIGRILLLCLLTIMTLTTSVFALYVPVKGDPSKYKDIENHWAYDAIAYVVTKGVFKGATADEFKPNENMTREELVDVIWRLTGEELTYYKVVDGETKEVNKYVNMFWDLKDSKEYVNCIAWANYHKIINGYSKREFGPKDSLTREQFATILYNYLKNYKKVRGFSALLTKEAVTFADNDKISDWASDKVSIIQQIGLMEGREDGTFDPQGMVTRAETAVVIERLMKM